MMKIGIIGLGRMGTAIAHRLHKAGYTLLLFDINPIACHSLRELPGVKVLEALEQMPYQVDIIWLMVPAGAPVSNDIAALLPHLKAGHVIIDGGNSHFEDSIKRAAMLLKERSVYFLDCGTSGGIYGLKDGFSLTVGGDKETFSKCENIFRVLASLDGYLYTGQSGTGHYVKMIHNGIEYALLQSYAEGFHLLHSGRFENLNLAGIASAWAHGSVIRSFILELIYKIYKNDLDFANIKGTIGETGMGSWTVEEAHARDIPLYVIEIALNTRAQSRLSGGTYMTKLIALLRHVLGGHSVELEHPQALLPLTKAPCPEEDKE
jgi:6-phosphogluconate dehydrogenase